MARHTFQVENIQAGLEQIKQELGPGAIIVQTRRVTGDDGKTLLEITAETNETSSEDIPAADAANSSAQHSTLRSITQLQKTILGLTEQIQRVQSEMRHLRMEVHTTQQTLLREETSVVEEDGDSPASPSPSPIELSPAFFEAMHAPQLRALRLALTQLRDQTGDRQLFETVVEIHAALVAQDVLPIHADMFCARLLGSNRLGGALFESARDILTASLVTDAEPWSTLPKGDGPKVALFIGPAGCGKTSMIAKVAAHASIKGGRHVALLSADAFRIGSHDQLETYAELIGIPVASADGLPLLERAVEILTQQHPDIDLVLVDATSFEPFEESAQEGVLDVQTLMTLSEGSLDLSTYMVMPATWSTRALLEYLEASRILKPSGVIWTMLDVARRFGALYSVARDVSIPMVLCSTGRSVPGDLSSPDPLAIARAILMNTQDVTSKK